MKKLFRSIISRTYHLVGWFIGRPRAEKIKGLIFQCGRVFEKKRTNADDHARLFRISGSSRPLRLHFGADIRILKGWINIDISPYTKPDDYPFPDSKDIRGGRADYFQIDFREAPLPLSDGSVDLVFHEDFIEHLTQKEIVQFLAETYRVLKTGGIHRINTPDLLSSLGKNCDFTRGIAGVKCEEWDKYGHHNVLTRNFLKELAKAVGYREVVFNGRNKSLSKDVPQEYRPGDDRSDDEQIFCDLVK
ncbi:MAG: hypothetical protein A2934_02765 [Candidatus Sungbacteria bacterium RIFCSPLOWO2_01_FULL_47_10]|uniref:Methyltransferase type 11 domain-containing protein n=1 Tax=Candidatus Sungbacteria bacterium RIFCSPLOWO2_01_FULL_47_10 TaxID=1802276 RepID=A0A1G2L0L5_9BACT|nr:MAG: hypothetical protein A2934_02765 [Candidatus Sungbacteria bacterium RIFCSPLOWO2_01_FULL_47_10]